MVELLIVAAIMSILIAMAVPFTTSLRAELGIKKSMKQIKVDLTTNLGYAMSGKSISALSSGQVNELSKLPSHYALQLKSIDTYGDYNPYIYTEYNTQPGYAGNLSSEVIYALEKEIPSPVVYIKAIRLKNASGGTVSTSGVQVITMPPLGQVAFVPSSTWLTEGTSLNLEQLIYNNRQYEAVEIDLQYKDEAHTLTTLVFTKNKVINIL